MKRYKIIVFIVIGLFALFDMITSIIALATNENVGEMNTVFNMFAHITGPQIAFIISLLFTIGFFVFVFIVGEIATRSIVRVLQQDNYVKETSIFSFYIIVMGFWMVSYSYVFANNLIVYLMT